MPDPVEIDVLLFAAARDTAGAEVLVVRVPPPATVAGVRAGIVAACPGLADLAATARVAVDEEFRADDFLLPDGAEVALIPPVSGG